MDAMTSSMIRLNNLTAEFTGYARQTMWDAEDGWVIAYTTERVQGAHAPNVGKFVTMAYKPVGKGARGGRRSATSWERVYLRAFSTRKAARARAEVLYYRHSPKIAARHGRLTKEGQAP
jgi:hypothetical protein